MTALKATSVKKPAVKKPAGKVDATKKKSPAKKSLLKKSISKTPPKPVWQAEERLVPYDRALAFMEAKIGMIREKGDQDMVWLLEHPPVYTAGTSAQQKDLLKSRFPVHNAGRGGQYTYHGPGQRIAYAMIDLQKRNPDLKEYVRNLEEWIIEALKEFGVKGERRVGRVGIWVDMKQHFKGAKDAVSRARKGEAKIAAIGVRVRKWVAYHGIAINVNPDLSHYDGIVPCGISEHGVTSLEDLGIKITMQDLDRALMAGWKKVFG